MEYEQYIKEIVKKNRIIYTLITTLVIFVGVFIFQFLKFEKEVFQLKEEIIKVQSEVEANNPVIGKDKDGKQVRLIDFILSNLKNNQ